MHAYVYMCICGLHACTYTPIPSSLYSPPPFCSLFPLLQKLALRRPVGEDSERYYLDLQRQAEERHRSRAREKEEDRRLAQQVLNEAHLLQRIVVAGVRAYMLGVLQCL